MSQLDPLSDLEAMRYYYGLWSNPVLVARTGKDTWQPPTGPEAYFQPKELRPVGNHIIKDIWPDTLAFQIHDILNSNSVKWTSTDVVRIGFIGTLGAPVCIWVGVIPNTLSRMDGLTVAQQCRQLLVANGIHDVEVEIRESVVTRYVGPKLEMPAPPSDPTAELVEPLTSTLGSFISNVKTPNIVGTGGFYVSDSESNLYLVTARHVVLKVEEVENKTYLYKPNGQPRVNIALFGNDGFDTFVQQIQKAISDQRMIIELEESRIKYALEGGDSGGHKIGVGQAVRMLEGAKRHVQEAKDALVALTKLEKEVVNGWRDMKDRIIGHLYFAPPIQLRAGDYKYTQDYALIKIDPSKLDAKNFTGNMIDLGTKIPSYEFQELMFPHPENRHRFKYPANRLMKVQGIISDNEISNPTMLDENGDPCLFVMKRGYTTGLTLGRANNIHSFVRNYFDNGATQTSREWPICPYNKRLAPFSSQGDSGAAIVDCQGRIGGLLTGGGGGTDSTDITYATPISFIMDSLKNNKLNVTIEASLTA